MENEIYDIFKRNFNYINRAKDTTLSIILNKDNHIIEKRNKENKLIGCSLINKNTILMLVVDKEYRNKGIGEELLKESEEYIKSCGFNEIIAGVGFNYLMPGIPTSKKYYDSVNENLDKEVNTIASDMFEKHKYKHTWDCNCFDMRMSLDNFNQNKYSIGDTINGIYFRWATINDIKNIIICADDACQYQDTKFSKYYIDEKLYDENNNQRVLVALKNNEIIGTLIISIETEGKELGSVGCTCVKFSETHKGIGTNLVRLGTKYLKDIGMKNASLSYTYSGLDKLYGASGYEISTYYMMAKKKIK